MMARRTTAALTEELEAIEALVGQHPEGIGRAALEAAFAESYGRTLPWRTLLRRLQALVAQDRVRAEGSSTRTVYRPGPGFIAEAPPPEEGYVPLSREGAQVRALVRRPISERKPVGYDGSFLERYKPGKTWYLPQQLRNRLLELGRTPDADRPAGTHAREIFNRLLIDLAWSSSRLEGNSYSRLDTLNLLEFGQRAEGKEATDAQMILNHKAAIEFLVDAADEVSFNLYTFQNLHALLADNLLGNHDDEGRLRTHPVDIGGTPYRPPSIPQKVEEWFRLMLAKAEAIPDPFEQSFFVMIHLPYLQPFVDVNKRTSRLGANISLIKENLCPLSFIDVPERAYIDGTLGVYELRRVELLRDVFVWAYERSCAQYRIVREELPGPDPLRLRYRGEMTEAVREVVLGGHAPGLELLRTWAQQHGIAADDLEPFATRTLGLVLSVHPGNLHRYRLRVSEYDDWKSRFAPA